MAQFDPLRHHRRSIRLKGYDYARAGAYFVTICAQHRELLFEPETVRAMIQRWWDKLPEKFDHVKTDAFVVMPNHIHGIIVIAIRQYIQNNPLKWALDRDNPANGRPEARAMNEYLEEAKA